MTGLEKIIEQIRVDSENICNKTQAEADAEAGQILARAQTEAEEAVKAQKQIAAQRCAYIAERAESGAELERRRTFLRAKQEIISEMLENSKRAILALNDEDYFAVLFKMLEKYSSGENGKIAFNARDLDRLPHNFIRRVKRELGLDIELCKSPVDIDGGFLLLYDGVEENCSFSAIFSGESEHLSDIASKILFQN